MIEELEKLSKLLKESLDAEVQAARKEASATARLQAERDAEARAAAAAAAAPTPDEKPAVAEAEVQVDAEDSPAVVSSALERFLQVVYFSLVCA